MARHEEQKRERRRAERENMGALKLCSVGRPPRDVNEVIEDFNLAEYEEGETLVTLRTLSDDTARAVCANLGREVMLLPLAEAGTVLAERERLMAIAAARDFAIRECADELVRVAAGESIVAEALAKAWAGHLRTLLSPGAR